MSPEPPTPGDGGAPDDLSEGQTGVERDAADANKRPPRGDPKPKARKRKAKRSSSTEPGQRPVGAALKAQSAKLEGALAEVLVFPAVPALMLAQDPVTRAYLPEHFIRTGPRTAHELVRASEQSPELRALLERLAYGSSMLTIVFAVLGYAAPPVLWMIGMRQQAAMLSTAAAMDESSLEAMMREARDAADSPPPPEQPEPAANGGGQSSAPAAA